MVLHETTNAQGDLNNEFLPDVALTPLYSGEPSIDTDGDTFPLPFFVFGDSDDEDNADEDGFDDEDDFEDEDDEDYEDDDEDEDDDDYEDEEDDYDYDDDDDFEYDDEE